jgi:flagellar biosynthesis protein FlhB
VAEEQSTFQEKTEAPTPRRLQQAREQGQVPLSRELATFTGMLAGCAGLILSTLYVAHDFALRLSIFLSQADSIGLAGGRGIALAVQTLLRASAPVVLAALFGGIAVALVQSGGPPAVKPLRLEFSRINPGAGARRMISPDTLVEVVKSLVKTVLIGVIVWESVHALAPRLFGVVHQDLSLLPATLAGATLRMTGAVLVGQGAIAAADVFWVRSRHARRLRMSRQDIREELKDTEGDPRLKARLRQLRMQRLRRRMMAAVPKATVVITNPTHYAVALGYDRARDAAPRVLAKGMDEVAARIRQVAIEHRVPLVSNPPLARALYGLDLDRSIPPEHYQAAAEIIAYVWRLKTPARPDAGVA